MGPDAYQKKDKINNKIWMTPTFLRGVIFIKCYTVDTRYLDIGYLDIPDISTYL